MLAILRNRAGDVKSVWLFEAKPAVYFCTVPNRHSAQRAENGNSASLAASSVI